MYSTMGSGSVLAIVLGDKIGVVYYLINSAFPHVFPLCVGTYRDDAQQLQHGAPRRRAPKLG